MGATHIKECVIQISFCALKDRNTVLEEKIQISGGDSDINDGSGDVLTVVMMVVGRSCDVNNNAGE